MSSEGDNSKIAMAGSSKRSVKEAYTRAKQWLRRRRKRGSASSTATPTSKHLPVVEDADSAAEMSSEDQSADDTDANTNLYIDSNVQSDA